VKKDDRTIALPLERAELILATLRAWSAHHTVLAGIDGAHHPVYGADEWIMSLAPPLEPLHARTDDLAGDLDELIEAVKEGGECKS
jgi:hypothetical protein